MLLLISVEPVTWIKCCFLRIIKNKIAHYFPAWFTISKSECSFFLEHPVVWRNEVILYRNTILSSDHFTHIHIPKQNGTSSLHRTSFGEFPRMHCMTSCPISCTPLLHPNVAVCPKNLDSIPVQPPTGAARLSGQKAADTVHKQNQKHWQKW